MRRRVRKSLRVHPKDAYIFPQLGTLSCKVLMIALKRTTIPTITQITEEPYEAVHACVRRLIDDGLIKSAGKVLGLNHRAIRAYRVTDDGQRAYAANLAAAEIWLAQKAPTDVKEAVTTFWVRPLMDDDDIG